ncbi:hypothetical protein B0H11DRAFT_2287974 [Mycena galericulata]|nr:hypothetical protein B0H11DRAFT_2287973 [Mycena galericulata]KAJ7454334.1 hypothetical protein B0H11DRAFT_2287974 [Mycena galericulata]
MSIHHIWRQERSARAQIQCGFNMATFLEPHVSGDANKYKTPVLKSLTDHLNAHIVIGGLKKFNGVKQKLSDVMAIYKGVHYLKTRSGGNWDDDFGANVITQTEAVVWESLILSRPECTPFRNQGWLPYPFIEKLDPAKPKGDNSYRPRIGVVGNDGASTGSQQPEDDVGSESQPAAGSGRSSSPDWDLSGFTQDTGPPDSQDRDDTNSSQLNLDNSFNSSAGSSIPSTPSASAPKRRAASSSADVSSKKKARVNPQDALFSVSQSLDTFATPTLVLSAVLVHLKLFTRSCGFRSLTEFDLEV